jgi:peptidoglycan hydrolase CwlO-like protein
LSSDALLGFGKISELWWGAAGVGGDEPLLPFRVKQEKEQRQVSELKNEVAGLKTEIAGLKGEVDSLDRKVTQMSGTINEMNHTLHSILDVVQRLQTVG